MKKTPSVITRGVAKVPVILQLEALECGAAALAMVMAYYGKWVPLEQVRKVCGVSRDGSNAKNICKAAENYGFEVKAYRRSPEVFKSKGRFPCIIHWNMNHFVVLDGIRGNRVYLNDPAQGTRNVSWNDFDSAYTGICIELVPSGSFHPEGKRKSTFEFARKRLSGTGAAVALVAITTILTYLFGIADSVTSRIFMDRLLTGINRNWLYPFTGIMFLLATLQLTVQWVQTVYSLKINGKMSAVGSSSYMWKVLRLPMDFFSQRLAGDIQGRMELNASIAETLVNTFAPLAMNSLMMIVYLVLMLKQSRLLTLIGLSTLFLNIFMARMISGKRVNISRLQMRDEGNLVAATVAGIEMIETIKASGAENGFFRRWAGYQASVNHQKVETQKTNLYWGMIPAFLTAAANYAVLLVGVYMAMQGNYTRGAVLMFQGFLAAFMKPVTSLISAGQTILEMRTKMERVEDVMENPEDPTVLEGEAAETAFQLEGNVELKHVTFGYAPLSEPLISDFSLSIHKGEHIAIVGASGCGKSTLSKLITGLYQPWSGTVEFDGRPRSECQRDEITGAVAVVDQEITMFEDTVEENIRLWDKTIKDTVVIQAAKDAQIHKDIINMPGGYSHRIESGGKNLSGGQRQRLEIARALAQSPVILILDEATSALDAKTEYRVVEAIRNRGITCIVIAHRLSAIRDCDRIIVLDHGKPVETGTHEELMKQNGVYAQLVASE